MNKQHRISWAARARDAMLDWVLGPDGQTIFVMAVLIGGIVGYSRLYPTPPSAPRSESRSPTYWEKREAAEMKRFLEGPRDDRDELDRLAEGYSPYSVKDDSLAEPGAVLQRLAEMRSRFGRELQSEISRPRAAGPGFELR